MTKRLSMVVVLLAGPVLAVLPCKTARALGTEVKGNAPQTDQPDWARGVLDVVNLKSRVYGQWVNGNESFLYRGDTAAANDALAKFAAVDAPVREVVLWPASLTMATFDGETIAGDWKLHVPSGIYLAMLGKAQAPDGTSIFGRHARMTIAVGGKSPVDLDALKVPAGITLLGPEDLKVRYQGGLKVDDPTIRGQAVFALGELGPIAGEVRKPIADKLGDKESYVRLCAAGALSQLGMVGSEELAALKEAARKAPDDQERQRLELIAQRLESAKDDPAAASRPALERIKAFREKHAGRGSK